MTALTFEPALRPCIVRFRIPDPRFLGCLKAGEPQNALFHGWSCEYDVITPSALKGGHPGGVVSHMVGIVELSDGQVVEVAPKCIQFIDNKHQEYAFPQEEQKDE